MNGPVEASAVVAAALVAGAVTFALRALPFGLLRPVRDSPLMARLAGWMPVGVLTILALVTFLQSAALAPGAGVDVPRLLSAVAATAVTAAVHLLGGRRTLASIGAGTLVYVQLVTLVAS